MRVAGIAIAAEHDPGDHQYALTDGGLFGRAFGEQVSESQARDAMARLVQDFEDHELLSGFDIDPAAAQTAYHRRAGGERGDPVGHVELLDYRFRIAPRLNSIPVHGAYVDVFVHRTGAVSRVSVRAPSVERDVTPDGRSHPTASGYWASRSVSEQAVEERFSSLVPEQASGLQVFERRLVYRVPQGPGPQRVEPTVKHAYRADGSRTILAFVPVIDDSSPVEMVGAPHPSDG